MRSNHHAMTLEAMEGRLLLSSGLDPSFGAGGSAILDYTSPLTVITRAAALQRDGKIVEVGQNVAARFNADGSLDASFATGGEFHDNFAGLFPGMTPSAVAVQADGKIIVAGNKIDDSDNSAFFLYRLTTDGSLDTTFGNGGWVQIIIGSDGNGADGSQLTSLMIQSNGQILVGGRTGIGGAGDAQFALVRCNPDGSLDQTFGAGGIVTTDLGSADAALDSLAILRNGDVLAGGTSARDFVLTRYTSAGALDASFGASGIVAGGDVGTDSGDYRALSVSSDGTVFAAGMSRDISSGDTQITLAHFDASGNADVSFGARGFVNLTLPSADGDTVNEAGLALDASNRLIFSATSQTGGSAYVMRVLADGSLDGGFGDRGVATIGLDGADSTLAPLLQPNDHILVPIDSSNTADSPLNLARLNTDGSLDRTFGRKGVTTASFTSSNRDSGAALLVQTDGKILLAGSTEGAQSTLGFIARYDANGSIDATFAAGGTLYVPYIASLAQQSDGKILVGEYGSGQAVIGCYNADGSIDASFGTNGVASASVGSGGFETTVKQIAVESNGTIVALVGQSSGSNTAQNDSYLATFSASGALIASAHIAGGSASTTNTVPSALALAPNGQIVVAGSVYPGYQTGQSGPDTMYVARFNVDLSPDTSFGSGGALMPAVGSDSGATGVAVQSDGSVVVAGTSDGQLALLRFTPSGQSDTTFASNGVALVGTGADADSVAILGDGQIAIAGSTGGSMTVALFNPDGSLTTTFGDGGVATASLEANDALFALATTPAGSLVTAATIDAGIGDNGVENTDVALTQYSPTPASSGGDSAAYLHHLHVLHKLHKLHKLRKERKASRGS